MRRYVEVGCLGVEVELFLVSGYVGDLGVFGKEFIFCFYFVFYMLRV